MARTKRGLAAVTSRGLNRKKIAKKGKGTGDRVVMKDGSTIPIQFYAGPDDFLEYEIHRFQEDGQWNMIPCLGDNCPLCDDEADAKSKTSYRFAAAVWNFTDKKAMILEGPKDLAEKILFRYDRLKNKAMFTKSTYEAVRFPTNPTTYGLDKGEEEPIKLLAKEAKDLDAYVDGQIKSYYGDDLPTASSLDSDDDDDDDIVDDDADTWTREELAKKTAVALAKIAKEEGASAKDIKAAGKDKDALISLIVGKDDDEDDDDDEDELDDLDRDELKAYIKENELSVKVTKSMDEDDIREAIREAEGDEDDDDEDDDEDD